jgi:hypothetical protein
MKTNMQIRNVSKMWNLLTLKKVSESRAETSGNFLNAVLEKDGED